MTRVREGLVDQQCRGRTARARLDLEGEGVVDSEAEERAAQGGGEGRRLEEQEMGWSRG